MSASADVTSASLNSAVSSPVNSADVYKARILAATLDRTPSGVTFAYSPDYLDAGGPAIASTLPVDSAPLTTPAGAVPPYFAGLLPEGRRLSALRAAVKTSADDELTMLVAVGADTIGDVQVVPRGEAVPAHPESLSIDVAFSELRFADLLTSEGMLQRPSLAGVQDKVSAAMINLPVARKHERYILKLNPPEHPHLVENEAWFLDRAGSAGLTVVHHRLVRDADGEPGLLVTRFDRIARGGEPPAREDAPLARAGEPLSLAVEDGCQALNLWPADKYNTRIEAVARALMNLTAAPLVAARDVLQQLTFAWISGNGDVHSKNLSVLTRSDGERRVSPAYDLPSTLFYGDTTLALSIGGHDTLSAARLRACAAELGVPGKSVDTMLGRMLARTATLADELRTSGLPFDRRVIEKAARQIESRRRVLEH